MKVHAQKERELSSASFDSLRSSTTLQFQISTQKLTPQGASVWAFA